MKNIRLFLTSLLMIASVAAFAQNINVKGTVTDGGEPVTGAYVVVTGTTTGAMTDADGNFAIANVPSKATLTVSFVGYKTAVVAAAAVVNVNLEPDTELLDQVVVTAQGLTRKQKAIGYSATTLSTEQLTTTHSSDLGNSLAGKVAGAQFWGAGGATFNEGSIVLRGATSYSDAKGNEPIYVVDGTITDRAAVNMDDVESINILKGPSATALYGSRGANGAVIVTTKKAKEGRGTIEFSHTTSLETYYNHIQLNTLYGGGSTGYDIDNLGTSDASALFDYYGYNLGDGTYMMDYYSDENWGPRYDGTTLVRSAASWNPESDQYGKAETWEARLNLKDLTQTAWSHTTNVAFSKAGEGYSTRVAFTNVERDGVMYNSKAQRRSFSIASSFKPTKWLTADLSYRYRYRKNKNAATEGYSADGNVICDFTQWGQTNVDLSYYKNYKNSDGSWNTWNIVSPEDLSANFHDNPYATMYEYNNTSTTNYHLIAADIYATLTPNWKLGVRVNDYINNQLYEAKHGTGSINWDPYFRTYQTASNDFTGQAYLMWDQQFVDNRLSFNVAAFAELRNYNYRYLNSYTNGGLSVVDYYNLAASASTYSTNNSETHYKTRSFFGTATIGWDDLVYLDGSIRYDVDSRLADGNNGYLYGGGSVSFMASKPIDAPWLNFWKIRASVAQVGSTIGAYNIYPTYTVGTKKNGQTTMYEPTTQKNQNIQPTISTSYEVGTEFKMFGNRFFGDLNFYIKNTENDIISANVLPQSGYAYRTLNAGLTRNKGVELMLGGTPVRTKNVEWTLSANAARNVNTLVELTPDQDEYTIYWTKFYDEFYLKAIAGKPIGVISTGSRFLYNEDGLPVLKKMAAGSAWGEVRPVWERGVEEEVGNVQPDLTGGFSTSLRLWNFTLGASLDYVIGGKLISWTNMWGTGSGTFASTAQLNNNGVNEREPIADGGGVYLEGVDEDGNPVSGYCNAYNYYHYKAYYDTAGWAYDRTYVKLRELSLRYDLPKNFVSKLKMTNASIAFVANNPWLIYSACPNIDPSEIAGTEYNYLEGGQAMSTRSFGLTLNVTF